ncbi:hypothetical protein [Microbacterium sp. A1-JK]|uniref:hypothetical protein n=1 Tax=Microbacterium sp. A1-JK TaxID=3177516 RepID=UPI0038873E8F
MDEKTVRLHYGGEVYALPESQADFLDEYSGEAGLIKLNLGAGKWLTIAVGPGIPVLIEESPRRAARVANIL